MSKDPAAEKQLQPKVCITSQFNFGLGFLICMKHYCFSTLLYEHGLSVIAPVLAKVAPLVIGLIYRAGSYLTTFRHERQLLFDM